MEVKLSIILTSHLSDIQCELGLPATGFTSRKINFIKYLIFKYPDTRVEVDPNKEWEEFEKKFPLIQDMLVEKLEPGQIVRVNSSAKEVTGVFMEGSEVRIVFVDGSARKFNRGQRLVLC